MDFNLERKMTFKQQLKYCLAICFLSMLLTSCNDLNDNCSCTAELRMNYCITINGSDSIPNDLLIVRKRSHRNDTLSNYPDLFIQNCFPESPGNSTLEVYRDDELIAETPNIYVKTVDCCHGESISTDITIP